MEAGVFPRSERVGTRTFYQVADGTTNVLPDKLVILPFAPGQRDVAQHMPPMRTDDAVMVYEVDLESLLQGWTCEAC
eukprot:11111127-Alexandrium_andersonii.AAC.1